MPSSSTQVEPPPLEFSLQAADGTLKTINYQASTVNLGSPAIEKAAKTFLSGRETGFRNEAVWCVTPEFWVAQTFLAVPDW